MRDANIPVVAFGVKAFSIKNDNAKISVMSNFSGNSENQRNISSTELQLWLPWRRWKPTGCKDMWRSCFFIFGRLLQWYFIQNRVYCHPPLTCHIGVIAKAPLTLLTFYVHSLQHYQLGWKVIWFWIWLWCKDRTKFRMKRILIYIRRRSHKQMS